MTPEEAAILRHAQAVTRTQIRLAPYLREAANRCSRDIAALGDRSVTEQDRAHLLEILHRALNEVYGPAPATGPLFRVLRDETLRTSLIEANASLDGLKSRLGATPEGRRTLKAWDGGR